MKIEIDDSLARKLNRAGLSDAEIAVALGYQEKNGQDVRYWRRRNKIPAVKRLPAFNLAQARRLLDAGSSASEIAKEMSVPQNMVEAWLKREQFLKIYAPELRERRNITRTAISRKEESALRKKRTTGMEGLVAASIEAQQFGMTYGAYMLMSEQEREEKRKALKMKTDGTAGTIGTAEDTNGIADTES